MQPCPSGEGGGRRPLVYTSIYTDGGGHILPGQGLFGKRLSVLREVFMAPKAKKELDVKVWEEESFLATPVAKEHLLQGRSQGSEALRKGTD